MASVGSQRRRRKRDAQFYVWFLLSVDVCLAFIDHQECGVFDPPPDEEVDDRIVNGYKVGRGFHFIFI